MLEKMKRFVVEEEGQGMTEYAVILAIVVAIAVAITVTFGANIQAIFADIASKLAAWT